MSNGSNAPASSFRLYLRLLSYVRPFAGAFAISLIGFGIFASSQPMLAGVLKYFVDGISATQELSSYHLPLLGDVQLMYGVPILMVLIIFWRSTGSYLGNYFLAKVSLGLINDLRQALFNSLLQLPNRYFDDNSSGHLISRITYNVTMVTGAATDAIKVVIREGLTVIFLFAYLLWMNWQLTAVMIAILPLIGIMVSKVSRKFRRQSKKIQESMGELTHIASESILSYRTVRSFGGEAYETRRFEKASADNMQKQLRLVKTGATFTPLLQLVSFSAMAVVLFLVIYLRGDATAGDLVAYITAAGMLPKPIRQLSEVSSTIQRGLAGAESIFTQLDEPPETNHGQIERDEIAGRLVFHDVSFAYPENNKPVLTDINFTVEPGQMIALVGRSGSGKSTLVNLIPRFYALGSGEITLDDIRIDEYTLRNLRQHIALVSQQVSLFNDSVANNIAYGDLATSPRELVVAAARAAHADEFIERLPQGYDTLIGENGVMLSGGQRQRLAIARAILKNAPLLILDEATSALDTESERHIQAALESATANRTTIVIAHRLSTIEKADLILVMDQGSIVERGTHAQLLAQSGHYARLYAMQFQDVPLTS